MECRDILDGDLEISPAIPIHVCLEKAGAEAQLASLSMSIERGITNPSKRILPTMTRPNVTIEATQVDVVAPNRVFYHACSGPVWLGNGEAALDAVDPGDIAARPWTARWVKGRGAQVDGRRCCHTFG